MKKRRQHYVWRYYLKPWSSNRKIYCLRGGKLFNPNLMGVANKRDFYRLEELTQNDIELIRRLVREITPASFQYLQLNMLNQFNYIFNFKRLLDSKKMMNPNIDRELDKIINNCVEDIHGEIERIAIKHIDSILKRNIDFYKSDNDCMDFLYFLCVQYMRTKKMKSNMASVFSRNPKIDIVKIWNVLSHIFATTMGAILFCRKSDFTMLLVNNNTAFPFITCDQPIINTYAVGKTLRKPVDKLEFYYPVSPSLAILLTPKKEYSGMEKMFFEEEDVCLHNSYIVKESHEQIYSNSKESLETYR